MNADIAFFYNIYRPTIENHSAKVRWHSASVIPQLSQPHGKIYSRHYSDSHGRAPLVSSLCSSRNKSLCRKFRDFGQTPVMRKQLGHKVLDCWITPQMEQQLLRATEDGRTGRVTRWLMAWKMARRPGDYTIPRFDRSLLQVDYNSWWISSPDGW